MKTLNVFLGLLLFFCVGRSVLAADAKRTDNSHADTGASLSKQRFFAYTSSFANRFKLPPIRPEPMLGAGLEAVEIGFGPRTNSEHLGCYMAIYVATSAISNEDFGIETSAGVLESRRHFFLNTRPDGKDSRSLMSATDSQHLLDRQSLYFMQASLTTSDYNPNLKSGSRSGMSLQEFVRDLLPGITYFRTGGCVPTHMIKHGKGVEFGIRRKGAPNYSRTLTTWREEHFDRFALPSTLLQTALPSLEEFFKFFEELSLESGRARREAESKRAR